MFQWSASIWIPGAAAFASLGVLVFSVWTANRARKEASESEKARILERTNHLENERRARLTSRLADILDDLPEILDILRRRSAEERVTGARAETVSVSPLIVRVIAAMLEADKDERLMLKGFRELLLASEKGNAWAQSVALATGSDLLVEWVHSAPERRGEVLSGMAEVASATSADEVKAIRERIFPEPDRPEADPSATVKE